MDGAAAVAETSDLPPCKAKFVVKGSIESPWFYLARRTFLEMLLDGSYDITAADHALTLLEFQERFVPIVDLQSLCFSSVLTSDPFRDGFGHLWCNQYFQNSGQTLHLGVCPGAELYQITDLLTNITKHKFMPRYEILSSEIKDQLLKYSLVEKQLLCML